jgi:hypothetical protein
MEIHYHCKTLPVLAIQLKLSALFPAAALPTLLFSKVVAVMILEH